jgi:DNA-nicking Smr family endonuclease
MSDAPDDAWEKFKRGAKRLPRAVNAKADIAKEAAPGAAKPVAKKKFVRVPTAAPAATTSPRVRVNRVAPPTVDDPPLLRRLQRGEVRWEATLDLHHLTEGAAHGAVTDFIAQATRQGWRYLLVITGRGAILRTAVPRWLTDLPAVRFFHPAERQHGGEGALYVVVRGRK